LKSKMDDLYLRAFWDASVDVVATGRHQFCPVDQPTECRPLVVLRIEDAGGIGPYYHDAFIGFDGSEAGKSFVGNALDARWGVRRFSDLKRHLAAARTNAKLTAQFGLDADLAETLIARRAHLMGMRHE
jgi:hypothetical protein